MLRFSEETLKHRPLGIRVIVEFIGTFILATVAAGSGVINHYVGGGPISRTAAVIAPGAVVMAMIYALGPLSGLHINPERRSPSRPGGCSSPSGRCPTSWCSSPAQFVPACSCNSVRRRSRGWELPDRQARRGMAVAGDGDIPHRDVVRSSSTRRRAIAASATTRPSPWASPWRCSGSSPARSAGVDEPRRTLGPDIVGWDFPGWRVYVVVRWRAPPLRSSTHLGAAGLLRFRPARGWPKAGALPLSSPEWTAGPSGRAPWAAHPAHLLRPPPAVSGLRRWRPRRRSATTTAMRMLARHERRSPVR